MSIQIAVFLLEKGTVDQACCQEVVVPGSSPGKVVIIWNGVVGVNAAKMTVGIGVEVTIFIKVINVLLN